MAKANHPGPSEIRARRVRISGDARDGIAMLSHLFSLAALSQGLHVTSLTEHPAEIRSLPNTLTGVHSCTVTFGPDENIQDDEYHLILAMNPAALKLGGSLLGKDTILWINADGFGHDELQCAGYAENPLHGPLGRHPSLACIPISQLTNRAINATRAGEKGAILSYREVDRSRNLFTLGMLLQHFKLGAGPVQMWLKERYKVNPSILDAANKALKSGMLHAENALELPRQEVVPLENRFPKGTGRRMILGMEAMVLALRQMAACLQGTVLLCSANRPSPVQVGPIATRHSGGGFSYCLAEDEASAAATALGVSYGGGLGCVSLAGVGFGHVAEITSMAIAAELPLVLLSLQRAGVSLGLPQRMAQSDLGMAVYGRNGEAPLVCFSPASPADVFATVQLAARTALRFLTPVCVLLDQCNAMASESWDLPASHPELELPRFASDDSSSPYACDEMLARPWIAPGTPGQEHRLGGNERRPGSTQVSFLPCDHAEMNRHREARMQRVASWIGPVEIDGPEQGTVLVISWGGTFLPVRSAVRLTREQGLAVSHLHLRCVFPLPVNLENLLGSFKSVLVAELNNGRLLAMLRERFEFTGYPYNRQDGCNFQTVPLLLQIQKLALEHPNA